MKKIVLLMFIGVILLKSPLFASSFISFNDKNIVKNKSVDSSSVFLLKHRSSYGSKKQIFSVAPIGLINKFRVKYEIQLNNAFSTGSFFNYYWGLFKGVRMDPFVRLYLGDESPKGIYIQAKFVVGYLNNSLVYTDINGNKIDGDWFTNGGAGINVGYQTLTGKNENWVIDINIGFKLVTPVTGSQNITTSGGNDAYVAENAIWYLSGPGSIFDGHIGIGYRF